MALRSFFTIADTDPNTERRGQLVMLIALVLLALLALAVPFTVMRPEPLPSLLAIGIGVLMLVGVLGFARSGRVGLAGWVLVLLTGITLMLPVLVRRELNSSLFYLLLPVVIAGLVLRPWQVWLLVGFGVAMLTLKLTLTPAEQQSSQFARDLAINYALLLLTIGTIAAIGGVVVQNAFERVAKSQAAAEAAALRFEELNLGLEQNVAARTAELRTALSALETRAAEQKRLLDELAAQRVTIRELGVPVLPVRRGTLVLPLTGMLDSERLDDLQTQALAAIERSRARVLLLDVTGVSVVDTHVAQGLLRTVQAARLLGAEPVLIGVRPEVAQTLVSLGVDLGDLSVARDLESALINVERGALF